MRNYILQTIKQKNRLDHTLSYHAYPNAEIYSTFCTFPDGTMNLDDDRIPKDAILETIVKSNVSLMKALPLSSFVKTEINIH